MRALVWVEPAFEADLAVLRSMAAECQLTVDFSAELARTYAVLLVARMAEGVAGFLLAWRAADELHLTDLGVSAWARRRGVASALVAALRAHGEAAELRVILLEVRESNVAARALYHKLLFRELDRRARYYSDTGEDAVVMQLELG